VVIASCAGSAVRIKSGGGASYLGTQHDGDCHAQLITEADQEAVSGRHSRPLGLGEEDVWLRYAFQQRIHAYVLTLVDHIKDLLDNAQQEALKQYTRLIQTINKTLDISTRVPRASASLTLKPTYLCLQCPSVATAEQRDRHEKGHRLCRCSSTISSP